MGGRGEGGVGGEGDEAVLTGTGLGQGFDGELELGDGGVEVLGVAGVEQPDRGAVAEDAGEPEGFGGEEAAALRLLGVVEDELLLARGEVAGGDGDGLAIAGFDEFELALVEGFADGVQYEGLGEGLLGGEDDVAEGDGHGGGDLGVERGAFAVFEVDLAVDERGVGAGGGLVEGPLEAGVGERDAGEREQRVGARVAQAVGGLGEEELELLGEFGRGGVEGVRELELEGAGGGGQRRERQRQGEAGGGVAGEAGGGFGGGDLESNG